MKKEIIGANAGIVWHMLSAKRDKMVFGELLTATRLSLIELASAIGWLARENKVICIEESGKEYIAVYQEWIHQNIYQNRSEEIFSRFMKLLSMHYKEERKVEFYASKLCITSKYLSSLVKKASGQTPNKWIDEIVMEEIQHLLRYSNVSIKEIAYQLNFSNASFFGKYVKRYTGVSPHQYRLCGV